MSSLEPSGLITCWREPDERYDTRLINEGKVLYRRYIHRVKTYTMYFPTDTVEAVEAETLCISVSTTIKILEIREDATKRPFGQHNP